MRDVFGNELTPAQERQLIAQLIDEAQLPRLHAARIISSKSTPFYRSLQRAMEHLGAGGFVVFIGEPGTGKTQALTELCRNAVKCGFRARYSTAFDLLQTIREGYEGAGKGLSFFAHTGLLCLDEVDKVELKPWASEQLVALIDARYRNKRPTVLAANLAAGELFKFLGPAIADRIAEVGKVMEFRWRSFRGIRH